MDRSNFELSRGARKRRRKGDEDQEAPARDDGAMAGGEGSAPASRTVLVPPGPAGGELGLEEANLDSINSCASSINSSHDSLVSERSARSTRRSKGQVAIQEYLIKSTELRNTLADNPEELKIINQVEAFVHDLLTGAGSIDYELEFNSDGDTDDSDSNSDDADANRDPTLSKYTQKQWTKIIDCIDNKRWKFTTVQQKYRKLTSTKEIQRARASAIRRVLQSAAQDSPQGSIK